MQGGTCFGKSGLLFQVMPWQGKEGTVSEKRSLKVREGTSNSSWEKNEMKDNFDVKLFTSMHSCFTVVVFHGF